MFRNEECVIVSFLQSISEGTSTLEEITERGGIEFSRAETEVPEWIKTRTAEELAVEMLEFKKKEFPEYENLGFYHLSHLFWTSKGIERHFVPSEIQLKMERANLLAQNEIRKEEEAEERKRFEKEKEELPSLVSHCIDWARTNGLKRLTLGDIDAYIMERNLDVLKETRRALYAMSNVKLKSKK